MFTCRYKYTLVQTCHRNLHHLIIYFLLEMKDFNDHVSSLGTTLGCRDYSPLRGLFIMYIEVICVIILLLSSVAGYTTLGSLRTSKSSKLCDVRNACFVPNPSSKSSKWLVTKFGMTSKLMIKYSHLFHNQTVSKYRCIFWNKTLWWFRSVVFQRIILTVGCWRFFPHRIWRISKTSDTVEEAGRAGAGLWLKSGFQYAGVYLE